MVVQLFFLDKAFGASRTFVRFDHVVFRDVNLQMFSPIEFLGTDVAQILFTFVYLNQSVLL